MKLDKECIQNPEEKTVVDERCYCGHLKSEHGPYDAVGYRACLQCGCRRFVWYGWVFEDGSEI